MNPPNLAATPADQNQELVSLRAENAELNERIEVVEHFCARLHDAMGAGEDLPEAGDEQAQADLAAIQAGMVELNGKFEAVETKNKEQVTLLATRDAKIVELETRLAAKADDKGGVVAAAPAAGGSEAGAVRPEAPQAPEGSPKLTAFEQKVEAAVKGGKARPAAIKELVSTEPKLFAAHLEEKGVIALGT